jgi:hypothetical protein
MKKIVLSFSLFLLIIGNAFAQQVEITPQFGYQIGAKYNYYNGYLKLTDSEQYGLTLNFPMNNHGLQADVFWVMQNAAVRIKDRYDFPRETELSEVSVNHFQFGFIQVWQNQDVQPFAGLSAGFTVFSPEDSFYDSNTRFSIGMTGGIKYFFTDAIGMRLQTQLLIPIEWGGVYIYPGGSSVQAGGSILQLNFSGGLIFAFGN